MGKWTQPFKIELRMMALGALLWSENIAIPASCLDPPIPPPQFMRDSGEWTQETTRLEDSLRLRLYYRAPQCPGL